MKRVHVLVEGQTEEAFLGRVVRPHLWDHGIDLTPKIVVTRRVDSGPNFKGGLASWTAVQRDLRLLTQDSSVIAVTTFLDYYGLPSNTPGMQSRPTGDARDKARHVMAAIDADHGGRVHSFLAVHEFEALLYTNAQQCGEYLSNPALRVAMENAVKACGEPELVNDDPSTAPSKRILNAHPTYQKVLHGPALAERIGLNSIRSACPHFDQWMTWLESLGATYA